MPDPKDNFYEGEYKLQGAGQQLADSMLLLTTIMEETYPKQYNSLYSWYQNVLENLLDNNFQKEEAGKSNNAFEQALKDNDAAKKVKSKLIEARKTVRKISEEGRDIDKKRAGLIKLTQKVLDTDSGDYGKAMADNPYLSGLVNIVVSAPPGKGQTWKDAVKYLGEEDPITHEKKKGPLEALNNFYSITADLIDREYEKQKLMADFTPEKEAEYLGKLNNDFKKLLENHKEIVKFVEPDGKSVYDPYFNNGLDAMAGKNLDHFDAHRGISASMENIRGQQKAIENGWGANELDMLGTMNEMSYHFKTQLIQLEKKASKEELDATIAKHNDALKKQENVRKQQAEELRIEQEKLDKLKKEQAKEEEIKKQEEAINQKQKSLDSSDKRIKLIKDTTDLHVKEYEENRNKYEQVKALSEEFKSFNESVMNTKVNSALEKYDIAEKLNKFSDKVLNAGIEDIILKNAANKCRNYAEPVITYAGRKPCKETISQEILDGSLDDEKAEKYKYQAMREGKFMPWMHANEQVVGVDNATWQTSKNQYDEKCANEREEIDSDHPMYIKTAIVNDRNDVFSFTIRRDNTEEQRRYMKEQTDKENAIFHESLQKNNLLQNQYQGVFKGLSVAMDADKGNFLQAINDNFYLFGYFTQLGGAPDLFAPEKTQKEKDNPRPSTEMTHNGLREKGIDEPLNRFHAASGELIEAEYYKQNAKKKGWDEKKETLFLAKFDEAARKTIESFEELGKFPREMQNSGQFLNNDLKMITGKGDNEHRDVTVGIFGLKWQREGIKNGWGSRHLDVLAVGGWMEGALDKRFHQLGMKEKDLREELEKLPETSDYTAKRESLKNDIDETAKNIKNLREFEKNEFKPLKESILGKKPESTKDILLAVTKLQDFGQKCKTNPLFNTKDKEQVFDISFGRADRLIIPRAINRCVEDIAKEKTEKIEFKPREFTVHDESVVMKDYLKIIRSIPAEDEKGRNNLESEDVTTLANSYLREAFLKGMNKEANPEYFNKSHPDYAVTNKKLDEYLQQYSDKILLLSEANSPKEFADALEFGKHSQVFVQMKDRISAEASKARVESFIAGKNVYGEEKSLMEAYQGLKNAPAKKDAKGSLYNDIASDLKTLDAMRKKMAPQVEKKMASENTRTLTGYENGKDDKPDKSKPIVDYKLAEPVTVDKKSLGAYMKKQKEAYERINKYLEEKNKLIQEKGGSLKRKADIKLLGPEEEKRYMAMLEAKKTLTSNNVTTREFMDRPITNAERIRLKGKEFGLSLDEFVDERGIIDDEAYKKRLDEERKLFKDDMKYTALRAGREIDNRVNEALDAEEGIRYKIGIDMDSLNGEAEAFEKVTKNFEEQKEEYRKLQEQYMEMGQNPPLKKVREFKELQERYADQKEAFERHRKPYEDKIVESAERSLFAETVKGIVNDREREMFEKNIQKSIADDTKVIKDWFSSQREDLARKEDAYNRIHLNYSYKGQPIPQNIKESFENRKNLFAEQKKFYENVMSAPKKKDGENEIVTNTDLIDKNIVDTAKRLESNKGLIEKVHELHDKGHRPLGAVEKTDLEQINEINALYQKGVNEFKKGSRQYESFDKNVVQNDPFRNEFRKRIIDVSKKKAVSREDVVKVRDSIIHDSIVKNITNKSELAKLDKLAKAIGSKVNSESILNSEPVKQMDNTKKKAKAK